MTRQRFAMLLSALLAIDVLHRFVSLAGGQAPFVFDAHGYWSHGRQMAAGDWFLLGDSQAFRTPLYPAFLAACQLLFGSRALVAMAISQHVMGMATALLVGWAAWHVTRQRQAFLVVYLVSMVSLGAVQYANHALSETLFALTIALHIAALAWWHRSPGLAAAAALGATLALTALVRPTTTYLWVPELLVLAVWGGRGRERWWDRAGQPLTFAAVTLLVVLPWLCRNQVILGRPALSSDLGQCLWHSCFFERGAALPMPAGDSASRLRGVDFRREFAVYAALRNSGLSEREADRWMTEVSVRAITEHPFAFARKVVRSWLGHWYVVEEAYPWYEQRAGDEAPYLDQRPWNWPGLTQPLAPLLRFAYRYSEVVGAIAGMLALAGALGLIAAKIHRPLGVCLLFALLYFSTVTAVVVVPLYRYRMVTFPFMTMAAVAGAFTLLARWRSQRA